MSTVLDLEQISFTGNEVVSDGGVQLHTPGWGPVQIRVVGVLFSLSRRRDLFLAFLLGPFLSSLSFCLKEGMGCLACAPTGHTVPICVTSAQPKLAQGCGGACS